MDTYCNSCCSSCAFLRSLGCRPLLFIETQEKQVSKLNANSYDIIDYSITNSYVFSIVLDQLILYHIDYSRIFVHGLLISISMINSCSVLISLHETVKVLCYTLLQS